MGLFGAMMSIQSGNNKVGPIKNKMGKEKYYYNLNTRKLTPNMES